MLTVSLFDIEVNLQVFITFSPKWNFLSDQNQNNMTWWKLTNRFHLFFATVPPEGVWQERIIYSYRGDVKKSYVLTGHFR